MTKCIEKIKHSCGSHALQVFEKEGGGYDGFCFACGTYVPNPYNDRPPDYAPPVFRKSPEQIQKEIEEVGEYPSVDMPTRRLKASTLSYFNVKVGVSEVDGKTPETAYFPYYKDDKLIGYKVRLLEPKKMWALGTTKDATFFGWQEAVIAGGKKLFITEGEFDAMALFQIVKQHNAGGAYADLNPAVVSLSNGAGGAVKQLSAMLPEIRKHFKEIVLVFDTDKPGKDAVEKVLRICPDAVVANIPGKDVNECLIEGRNKAVYNAVVFNAAKPKNTRLVYGADLHESAKEPPIYGVSWPWRHITEATRGIRLGETIYIGAGQKQGKSEVVNTLAAHFIQEHGWKVFLIKPEESNKKTYKLVAGKIDGKFFHDPNKPFDEAAYERAGKILDDKLMMLNLYQHVGWDTLKVDIRAAAAEGCKAIIILSLIHI